MHVTNKLNDHLDAPVKQKPAKKRPSKRTPERKLLWEIINTLEEKNFRQVQRTIQTIGVERTRALLEETLAVEANGGLLVNDGSRRRTPGGVFFWLTHQRVSPEEWQIIQPPTPRHQLAKERARSIQPLDWNLRVQFYKQALPLSTEAKSVKVTVIGRPEQVTPADSCVLTIFTQKKLPDSLPRGLPKPTEAETRYAVFIANKQWRRVERLLQEDEEDQLIIDGHCVYEPKIQGLAVMAKGVTTVKAQRAKWAAQAEKGNG